MSDSPPSRERAMQRRPTMSESSAWKNWLLRMLEFYFDRKVTEGCVLPSVGTVDSYFINLSCVISQIFHMSKNMSSSILRNEVSEICSQSHICNSRFVVTP